MSCNTWFNNLKLKRKVTYYQVIRTLNMELQVNKQRKRSIFFENEEMLN